MFILETGWNEEWRQELVSTTYRQEVMDSDTYTGNIQALGWGERRGHGWEPEEDLPGISWWLNFMTHHSHRSLGGP